MSAEVAGVVSVLGIEPGHLVWEMGVDDDCDDELRSGLASVEGLEVIDAIATTPTGPGDRPLEDVVIHGVDVVEVPAA